MPKAKKIDKSTKCAKRLKCPRTSAKNGQGKGSNAVVKIDLESKLGDLAGILTDLRFVAKFGIKTFVLAQRMADTIERVTFWRQCHEVK